MRDPLVIRLPLESDPKGMLGIIVPLPVESLVQCPDQFEEY
jgi:hypothetical protein